MKCLILLLLWTFIRTSLCYGVFAHKLIAQLTWYQLTLQSKQNILEILPKGVSFIKLSYWADTVKHQKEYNWTQNLHYANLFDDPPHYCINIWQGVSKPNVVSAAVNFTKNLLTSRHFIDLAFMRSLNFLVSGKAKGGLRIKLVDDGIKPPKKISLHYLLDSLIFLKIIKTAPFNGNYQRFLRFLIRIPVERTACVRNTIDLDHCYEQWALQTNQLNCQHFWNLPPSNTVVDYIKLYRKEALKLVMNAANHLAQVLNMLF